MFRDLMAVAAVVFFLFPRPARAASLTKNFTFSSGSVAYSSQVNSDFDQLFTEVNSKETRLNALEGEAWSSGAGNLNYTAGKIGIGTVSPGGALDVTTTTIANTSTIAQRWSWSPDTTNWGLKLNQRFVTPPSGIHYDWIVRNGAAVDINVMTFMSTGNVGIGTTNPGYLLDVQGGGINTSGAYTNVSDARLKTHVKELANSLAKILRLRGVSFDWIDRPGFDRSRQIGFLAQEVQKEFPEAVKTGADGTLSLSYSMLVAPLAEALKELAGFVSQLRLDHDSAVQRLRHENQTLSAQLAVVEAELCRKDASYSFCRP